MHEILQELENLSDNEDIPSVIIMGLPDINNNSDEDSGDEDCGDINKLNRNQLEAPAEFFFDYDEDNNEVIDMNDAQNFDTVTTTTIENATIENNIEFQFEGFDDQDMIDNDFEITTIHESEKNGEQNLLEPVIESMKYKPIWKKGSEQLITDKIQINWDGSLLRPLTLSSESEPIDFFNLLFPDHLIDYIVDQSNSYAAGKGKLLNITREEIFVVIGILYLSGYNSVPRRKMYWEDRTDTKNLIITDSMRRNRFNDIFGNLHFADNSQLNKDDRLAKIRPIINKFNDQFLEFAAPEANVSVDESMIPYFGRNNCKQFIANKPVRFGYKAWVMAQKLGYCLHFDVYQGASAERKKNVGLGELVVLENAHILKQNFVDLLFNFYFDNFFSGVSLVLNLNELNFGGTGTIRENRLKDLEMINCKDMKKSNRGYFESCVDEQSNLIVTRWMDNSVVTVISNSFGVNPINRVRRYSRKEKKYVDMSQPHVIKQYNAYMGGVDQMDNNISNYRINIRGNRYYFPIFLWILDVAMNNAWTLSRKYGLTFDNLEFRRKVVENILSQHGHSPLRPGRQKISNSIAKRQGPHIVKTMPNRLRCKLCKSHTNKMCDTCDLPLHVKCFEKYHA